MDRPVPPASRVWGAQTRAEGTVGGHGGTMDGMSDISPWVPKHGLRPVGQQTCSFSPTGREEDYCGKPATWHVKWDATFDVSATCDVHMEVVQQRWVYDNRHAIGADCNMPGALWYVQDNVCRVPWEADKDVAAARQELAAW